MGEFDDEKPKLPPKEKCLLLSSLNHPLTHVEILHLPQC